MKKSYDRFIIISAVLSIPDKRNSDQGSSAYNITYLMTGRLARSLASGCTQFSPCFPSIILILSVARVTGSLSPDTVIGLRLHAMIFGVSTVGSWSISGSHPYKGKIKPHTNVTVNCVNIFQAKLKLLVSPTLLQWYSEIPVATPKPPYIKGSVMEEKTEWNKTVELTNEG